MRPGSVVERNEIREVLSMFYRAAKMKYLVGNFHNAAALVEDFDNITEHIDEELRNKLRRGMFLMLK